MLLLKQHSKQIMVHLFNKLHPQQMDSNKLTKVLDMVTWFQNSPCQQVNLQHLEPGMVLLLVLQPIISHLVLFMDHKLVLGTVHTLTLHLPLKQIKFSWLP
jgi:hypothetical protein